MVHQCRGTTRGDRHTIMTDSDDEAVARFESMEASREDKVVAAIFSTFTYPSFDDAKRCLDHDKLQAEYHGYDKDRHEDLAKLFGSCNSVEMIKELGAKYNTLGGGGPGGFLKMQELFYSYSNTIGWFLTRAQQLQHGDREPDEGEVDPDWEHDPHITAVAINEICRQVKKNWDGIGNWMY